MDPRSLIEDLLGSPVASMSPLTGGCIAEVYRVRLADGRDLAVKVEMGDEPALDLEAGMLAALSAHAPTPRVEAAGERVLAMEFVDHAGGGSEGGYRRLGEIVAALHAVTAPAYGFDTDTRIGPIRLTNGRHADWNRFYFERRLLPVCELAAARGALPGGFMRRLDEFGRRLDELLGPPGPASLIHGDLWAGNVLWKDGTPAALIDPSTQWADREFELAFIDLMGGVSAGFWDAYERAMPIRQGFRERRIHAYQAFPLAVHAALFGGGYGARAMASLTRALA